MWHGLPARAGDPGSSLLREVSRCSRLSSLRLEREAHLALAVLDRDLAVLLAVLLVPGMDGVVAVRQALGKRELAVLVADREVRVVDHGDPRSHPRMHVAFHADVLGLLGRLELLAGVD